MENGRVVATPERGAERLPRSVRELTPEIDRNLPGPGDLRRARGRGQICRGQTEVTCNPCLDLWERGGRAGAGIRRWVDLIKDVARKLQVQRHPGKRGVGDAGA